MLTLFDFEASTRDEAITVYTRAGGKSIDRLAPCSSMNLQAIAVPREPARKFSMTFERHKGLFEIANRGTLFLDEISELPMSIQSKLLRVLQEGEMIRVGGDKILHVDTRIICSSNKDLLQLIQDRKFKDDLYYRLCVLEVNIPPLRERPEDIATLSLSLAKSHALKHRKKFRSIAPEVLDVLSRMQFKGNIRELSSIIERMIILSNSPVLDMNTLEKCNLRETSPNLVRHVDKFKGAESLSFKESQRQLVIQALEQCGRSKPDAAKLLGIDLSTLYRKIKAYNI